jgi:23S rRNA (cytidine1920-2'-O)/16S rRNA (cytidine1409-2'-O)-methyltransferase
VVSRPRLDAELVRRGLARSRRQAAELIDAGRVSIDGKRATKSSTPADDHQTVIVEPDATAPEYASRGGHKLAGALDALSERWGAAAIDPSGRYCLDAGASTGGFTDVLLQRGARHVVAVDVGHDQLVSELRADPRVEVREGANVRVLQAGDVEPAPTLVVADLSFISLTLVLPALRAVAAPSADLLVMVKPQFEVGRERIGSSGVVRSTTLRYEAVLTVVRAAVALGLGLVDVVPSSLPGPSGNVEYFVWLREAGSTPVPSVVEEESVAALVTRGVASVEQGGAA